MAYGDTMTDTSAIGPKGLRTVVGCDVQSQHYNGCPH